MYFEWYISDSSLEMFSIFLVTLPKRVFLEFWALAPKIRKKGSP